MRRTFFFVSTFLAALACAQAAPDFSGEWKMNVAQSDFGQIPAPEILTRTVKHHEPTLEYKSYQKGVQGEVTTEIKYTTDGKPCVNKVQGGDAKGTAKWQGNNLVIESAREFQGMEITNRDVWTLSTDGKTLTIASHVTIPGQGEFNVNLVFDKQ